MDTQRAKNCGICGKSGRLVRDHNHATGYIRGLLCERCNSWLGVFEANRRRVKQKGSRRFQEWQKRHADAILAHLRKNTGVIYTTPYQRNPSKARFNSRLDRDFADAAALWHEAIEASRSRR